MGVKTFRVSYSTDGSNYTDKIVEKFILFQLKIVITNIIFFDSPVTAKYKNTSSTWKVIIQ